MADLPQLSHLALPLIGEGRAEVGRHDAPRRRRIAARRTRAGYAGPERRARADQRQCGDDRPCGAGDRRRAATRRRVARRDRAVARRLPREPVAARRRAQRRARPAPGQVEAAAQLRALLDGSALLAPRAARRVQDPLSSASSRRCRAPCRRRSQASATWSRSSSDSAAESPLVIAADGVMLSNGNFHLPALALALDAAAIALAQSTSLAVERVIRFMSPAFTDLPLQLTRHGPAHSGFATLQKTVTALWAEIRGARQSRVARLPARVGRRRGSRDDGARRRGTARRHARTHPVRRGHRVARRRAGDRSARTAVRRARCRHACRVRVRAHDRSDARRATGRSDPMSTRSPLASPAGAFSVLPA